MRPLARDVLVELLAILDGEGGFTVWGKQVPAPASVEAGFLPLGLAHDVKLRRAVATGEPLRWSDVDIDETRAAVQVRREMERAFAPLSPNTPAGP